MSSIWPDRNRVPKKACRLLGLLLALALLPCKAQAQPATSLDEVGRFYAQIFAPQDYGADAQNWAIVQSSEGLIYVANGSGVLEYDGVSWRLIRISNGLAARSLAIDTEGRVYVGAQGEMGYLAVDSLGRMRYVSLLDHVPPDDRAFAVVWNIEETSDGLYFRTNERLFRWNGREMKVWRPTARFGSIFALSDTLYVQHRGIGLMRVVDDVLVMAPGGAFFKKDRIRGLMPWGEAAYLVVTQHRGMFRCPTRPRNEAACSPFAPGLTELLTPLQPYCTSLLPEGRLAIGTQRGGVVLLDGSGRLLRIFDETSGLRDETVWCTCVDRQGGLWLGLNNGLARVEAASALSYFDKSLGLPGNVEHVTRHQGRLYAATSLGVYQLRPAAAGAPARFEPIPGITTQCSSLLSTEEALLAGGAGGLYDVDAGRKLWRAGTGMHVTALHRSRRDPTLIYLGLYDGLVRMRLGAGRWTDAERIDGVRGQVRSIAENALGELWLGTRTGEVLRLEPATDSDQPIITRFGVEDGLPAGWGHAITVAGRVTFLGHQGTGLFGLVDVETGLRRGRHRQTIDLGFVPDTTFSTLLTQGSGRITKLTEDPQSRVWIAAGEASGVASPSADGGYTYAPTVLRRVPHLNAWNMLAEVDGQVWVGGSGGLIRLDGNRTLDLSNDYSVSIRYITTSGDSLLYNGQPGEAGEAEPWSYQDNALRFAFAAPRYDAPERTQYRTRLDGFDDDWSTWSIETDRDYTNLWEGRYVFRVQARDVYGLVSQEDSFGFRILPPWYRTWWAYLVYCLVFVALVAAYASSNRKKLRRERAVSAQLRTVSTRLREVDRLKDEFLANTSHELRTPLNGIAGLAESLIDGVAGEVPEAVKSNLSMIVQSGHRLSHLVGDILDFSKLRHKDLQLELRPVDLRSMMDVVMTLSRPLVGSKKLELSISVPADLPAALADENRLQQILHNLIGNAVKFTESGSIEVSAALSEEGQAKHVAGEQIVVRVADTGIGIPADKQERIFNAFEQADSSVEREYGGTGLGLAVTRKFVELHGGELWVESTPGEGSVFSFTLPIADAAAEASGPEAVAAQVALVSELVEALPAEKVTASEAAAGAPRILVVDDDPINRQVLHNFLVAQHCVLTTVSSGDEALRLLREHTFELVLLDIMMPRMSGYEVCRTIREQLSRDELPVIFLSAKNRISDRVTGFEEGGNDYLTKPIARSELLARVEAHLELLEVHRSQAEEVKVLRGMLPICSWCKKIRDDRGCWNKLEVYIDSYSEAKLSHGICPECLVEHYPEVEK